MSAAEPTQITYVAEVVRGLFPFLARFGLTPAGALSIRAAAEAIVIDALETIAIGASAKAVELAGGARGGVLTPVDTGGKFNFDPGAGLLSAALFYKPPGGSAYVLVTLLPAGSTIGGTVPPIPSTGGTTVTLGPGSSKVSAG